jgi:hypothetical protein
MTELPPENKPTIRETAIAAAVAGVIAITPAGDLSAGEFDKLKQNFVVQDIKIDPNIKNYGIPEELFKSFGNYGINFEGNEMKLPSGIPIDISGAKIFLNPVQGEKGVPNFLLELRKGFAVDENQEVIIQFNGSVDTSKGIGNLDGGMVRYNLRLN